MKNPPIKRSPTIYILEDLVIPETPTESQDKEKLKQIQEKIDQTTTDLGNVNRSLQEMTTSFAMLNLNDSSPLPLLRKSAGALNQKITDINEQNKTLKESLRAAQGLKSDAPGLDKEPESEPAPRRSQP